MSEIEKLMQNAGIEKASDFNNCYPEIIKCCHCEHYKVIDEYTGRCLNEVYPEFSPEKQIELLCFLINFGVKITMQKCDIPIKPENIANNLTGITNELWQDFTEEEKEEIKRILK